MYIGVKGIYARESNAWCTCGCILATHYWSNGANNSIGGVGVSGSTVKASWFPKHFQHGNIFRTGVKLYQ